MKKLFILALLSLLVSESNCTDPALIYQNNSLPLFTSSMAYNMPVFLPASNFFSSPSYSGSGLKYGHIAAPVVLAFSLASEITKYYQMPSLPLGVSAILITTISTPLIAANAQSLNDDWKKVKTAGWVAYGGGMLCSSILVSMGIAQITPPTPVIAVTGVMLASSILLMTSCTNHSNTAGTNLQNQRPQLNVGIVPVKNGGVCTLALNF